MRSTFKESPGSFCFTRSPDHQVLNNKMKREQYPKNKMPANSVLYFTREYKFMSIHEACFLINVNYLLY